MKTIKKVATQIANGTCLQGYVQTTYDKLVELLGEPNRGQSGDGKVNCEWVLDIDGEPITIYDWKQEEIPKEEYGWHVGGLGVQALLDLKEALNLPTWTWRELY